MGLKCQLFTMPIADPRLERCLVDDAGHITPGSAGDHVKKIQMALNQLSVGPGRENFNLTVDGRYGPGTAAAVKTFKNRRKILQQWQTTADDIVGKRTIESLDQEMEILEEESDGSDTLFSSTHGGPLNSHDHSKCATAAQGAETLGPDKIVSHRGTPLKPLGLGRRINIFGTHETDYLGFEDYSTNIKFLRGRPWTKDKPPPHGRGIASNTVSDMCIKSSPIEDPTKDEIPRIAMLGCRLTYASPSPEIHALQFFRSLGPVIAHGWIRGSNVPGGDLDLEVVVVQILFVKRG